MGAVTPLLGLRGGLSPRAVLEGACAWGCDPPQGWHGARSWSLGSGVGRPQYVAALTADVTAKGGAAFSAGEEPRRLGR